MLWIAICDDDAVQLEVTRRAVMDTIGDWRPQVDLFSDGVELLRALERADYRPDIAILDIQMPGGSGIEVGKRLNELVPSCRIIFLTSYIGYATDVYETKHSYFVLKSELARRIGPALDRALADMEQDVRLTFRAVGEVRTVDVNEVLYFERNLRKTRVVCQRGTYETGSKPEELLRDVPSERFVHCHQSFWVQLRHVKSMGAEKFTLSNGVDIPISRGCRAEAKAAFFASLHRNA